MPSDLYQQEERRAERRSNGGVVYQTPQTPLGDRRGSSGGSWQCVRQTQPSLRVSNHREGGGKRVNKDRCLLEPEGKSGLPASRGMQAGALPSRRKGGGVT